MRASSHEVVAVWFPEWASSRAIEQLVHGNVPIGRGSGRETTEQFMPEWTNLALMDDALPHVALSDEAIEFLEAHSTDEHQRSMMAEAVIEVDREDHILGPLSKVEAHRGSGRLHRAFSLLIFDSKGRLLLQQRASDKKTFPGVWANTCCSHPLHVAAEMDPVNGAKHAAIRKMEQELGVAPQAFEDITLHQITKMTYRARMDEHWVEEELDHLIISVGDLEVDPNPNEVQSTRWVTEDDLNQMLEADSEDAVIAPWFRLIATEFTPQMVANDSFGGDLATLADERIHHLGDATHLLPLGQVLRCMRQCMRSGQASSQESNASSVHQRTIDSAGR